MTIGPKVAKPTPAEERRARAIVKARDNGVCVKCLRAHPIHGVNFDHRQNASQGGRVTAANGQLLCGSGTTGCHGWKTSNPAEALKEGFAVPGWADSAVWPARRWMPGFAGIRRRSWVLLGDDGSVTEISEGEALRRMEGETA